MNDLKYERHGRSRVVANWDQLQSRTRPFGIRVAVMTLRLLEAWRSELGLDLDSALIVLATAAVTMEKFTRQEFDAELGDIRSAMPPEMLTRCYVSSIAAATGLNRETARRKVKTLIAEGILLADDRGSLRLSPAYTCKVRTTEMLAKHLQTIVHSTNELLKSEVVEVSATFPHPR